MLEVKRVMPWILLEREKVAGGDGRALFHGYRVGSFHSRTGGQAVQEAKRPGCVDRGSVSDEIHPVAPKC
jgi:hypothetical protein